MAPCLTFKRRNSCYSMRARYHLKIVGTYVHTDLDSAAYFQWESEKKLQFAF